MVSTGYITGVTKGEAFKLYYGTIRGQNNPNNVYNPFLLVTANTQTLRISKDGGAFATLTNSPVAITGASGVYYINLTADEMNADVIIIRNVVKVASEQSNSDFVAVIYTTANGNGAGGMSLTDTVTDITSLSDENPTVREILSFLWLYFRKRRKRDWWSLYRHIFRG